MKESNSTNYVAGDEEMLLMRYVKDEEAKEELWFLDSGCNNHVRKSRVFTNESFKTKVTLRDNSSMTVIGKRQCSYIIY